VLVTPSFAQDEPHAAEPGHATEGTEAHGGEHGAFPPFDPATFGPQLLWLAISFGLLYLFMSRVAVPRIGAIIEKRNNTVAGDLAQAGRLKEETDAAIAAYEQALAEARQNAHALGQNARAEAKAGIDAERRRIEEDLQQKLAGAETRIADVKSRALAEVDAIARDAASTMVEVLLGAGADERQVSEAVRVAMAERAAP
jgi:F-type H+-transporting ATPase subunit b